MSLKWTFVPKSDVKQYFTTTTYITIHTFQDTLVLFDGKKNNFATFMIKQKNLMVYLFSYTLV